MPFTWFLLTAWLWIQQSVPVTHLWRRDCWHIDSTFCQWQIFIGLACKFTGHSFAKSYCSVSQICAHKPCGPRLATQFNSFPTWLINNLETWTRFVIDGWGLLKFGLDLLVAGWKQTLQRPLTAQVKVNVSDKRTTWLVVLVNSSCTLDVRQRVRCLPDWVVKWSTDKWLVFPSSGIRYLLSQR